MSGPGLSAAVIVLSADERAELVRRSAGPESRQTDRARIILACADDPGASNAAVARELEVSPKSVAKWRRRFAGLRLAGLDDDLPIGRPKAELVLDDAERARLTLWARQAKTAQFLAMRARIVLACAEGGRTNKQVAADLGLDESTVDRWRAPSPGRRPPTRSCAPSPSTSPRSAADSQKTGRINLLNLRRRTLEWLRDKRLPTLLRSASARGLAGRGPPWPAAAARRAGPAPLPGQADSARPDKICPR
jgi:transposase-like protein